MRADCCSAIVGVAPFCGALCSGTNALAADVVSASAGASREQLALCAPSLGAALQCALAGRDVSPCCAALAPPPPPDCLPLCAGNLGTGADALLTRCFAFLTQIRACALNASLPLSQSQPCAPSSVLLSPELYSPMHLLHSIVLGYSKYPFSCILQMRFRNLLLSSAAIR